MVEVDLQKSRRDTTRRISILIGIVVFRVGGGEA